MWDQSFIYIIQWHAWKLVGRDTAYRCVQCEVGWERHCRPTCPRPASSPWAVPSTVAVGSAACTRRPLPSTLGSLLRTLRITVGWFENAVDQPEFNVVGTLACRSSAGRKMVAASACTCPTEPSRAIRSPSGITSSEACCAHTCTFWSI